MKARERVSLILIVLGVISILGSGVLFVQNKYIEENASEKSTTALEELKKEIEVSLSSEVSQIEALYEEILNEQEKIDLTNTNEVTVDDKKYIGILSIPKLSLELPVQSGWSYEKLNSSPCVYKDFPFSIAAHNYSVHFGSINKLVNGDKVSFKNTNGIEKVYTVTEVTKVYETNVEALQNSDYDLTLFTCNYNNDNERILVRLIL